MSDVFDPRRRGVASLGQKLEIATADREIQRVYGVRRQSVSVDAALDCRAAQDILTRWKNQSCVVGCAFATAVHKMRVADE